MRHPITGRAFLDDFTVTYAVSAHTLYHLRLQERGRPPSPDAHLLAVGNPRPSLDAARAVQETLRRLLPRWEQAWQGARPHVEAPQVQQGDDLLEALRELATAPLEQVRDGGEMLMGALLFVFLAPETALPWREMVARLPRPLRFAALEASSLADLWPGQTTLLLEDDATRDAVWNALAHAGVAHFATHGTFNPETPLDSALLLAHDTRLTLRDLVAAGPQALRHLRLAVLSACQTAIPDFNNLPDEVIGLPAGFHQAGVPGVVGSLWPVDDVSTALLMVRFYEYWLGQGPGVDAPHPPADALAAAQRWLRDLTYGALNAYLEHHRRLKEEAPVATRMPLTLVDELWPRARRAHLEGREAERPYAHPYYWAGFVYYGAHPAQQEVTP